MSESPAYQVVRGIVSAVVKDTESPAGGTVSLANLPLPTTGYFVGGAVPELVFESFATVDGPKIVEFVESAPSRYVGWWVDTETGRVHVDAVNWYQEEFTASAIARARGGLAVWDIARSRELGLAYVEGERSRPLNVIAEEIVADWPKARDENHPAGAYCVPLLSLSSVRAPYYAVTGKSIVLGFLANAGSWRGETARRIKLELKGLL